MATDETAGAVADDYRAIFEATGDGVIIADMDGNLVEVNSAVCRMHGYTREEMLRLYPTEFIHPAYHGHFAEYLASLNEGRSYRTTALDIRKDGSAFPVEVNGTVFLYRGERHMLGVVRDVSDRVAAEEQYRSVFESSLNAILIADMENVIVEANPAACAMYGYARDELVGLHGRALVHPDSQLVVAEARNAIRAGEPYSGRFIGVRKDGSSFYSATRAIRFMYGGKPHILWLGEDVTERVKAQELLEQRVEERTRELETLLEVARNVASTLELKPLLELILDQMKVATDYEGASILSLEDDSLRMLARHAPGDTQEVAQHRTLVDRLGSTWETLSRGEPVIVGDVRGDSEQARDFREANGRLVETVMAYVRSWLAVPLMYKERVIGLITLASGQPDFYTPRHGVLVRAIANQAAIAIENARLYEQAQEVAVLEERQRLSRELHDSVSQALYSIALGARTARAWVDRDPTRVAEPVEFVLNQAERALAEMRALIFELRPEVLEREGLVGALQQQVEVLRTRSRLDLEAALDEEPDVPLPVKEALYRIAQEALQNVVKHAQATRVELRLLREDGELVLEIHDNEIGFDTASSFPGHLGLRSMRERMEAIGGTLDLESGPGAGTVIRVRMNSGRAEPRP